MANRKIFTLFVILIALLFTACVNSNKNEASDHLDDTDMIASTKLTDENIGEMISSIPNPVEMSSLLQKSGVVYSQELLNPANNLSGYNTNFKKALNLGVYGTDLVYMNIYDRTVATLQYLRNVKDLAGDLRVGQFFDYETLNRLSESSKNIDSVLFITNSGFDKMSRYLIDQKRSNIAVLISYGTWIESMYIATNVQTIPPNKDIIYRRIAEQKVILENMTLLLNNYRKDPNFADLFNDLLDLIKAFDNVKIQHIYIPPTIQEINGSVVIIDNSRSEIFITQEMVDEIAKKVSEIRTKIIS
ncbi:MAG: hypothetical protein KGZ97_10155 [Bacteroidetes bacterium]|nr:hypothetical protein [Bacteroidota bacterium]